MKAVLLLVAMFISIASVHAVSLDDISMDNSKSVPGVQSAQPDPSLFGVWGQISKDPPKSMKGFVQEYREYGGGPVSGAMGIQPYRLTNGLVKAFSGLMLMVFLAASIVQQLQKMAQGGGELNYISLFGMTMLGVIVIFHPDYVYASGRIIQTAGTSIAYAALKSEVGQGIFETVKDADLSQLTAGAIEAEAANRAESAVQGYVSSKPERSIEAFNKSNKIGKNITVSDPNDQRAVGEAAERALGHFAAAVAANKGYQDKLKSLRAKYAADMVEAWGDKPRQDDIAKGYLQDVTEAASAAGYQIYGISLADRAINRLTEFTPNWQSMAADWLAKFVSGMLLPLAMWILTKGAQLALELTTVVVCVMYPFAMLDATKKAWLGSVKTFFSIALIPTVGIILLLMFETFMAYVAKFGMTQGGAAPWWNMVGSQGWALLFSIAFLIFWIIGVGLILWKTPRITKTLLEGGSVLGSLAGSLLTAAAGTALTAVGIAGLATGAAPALAPLLKGAKGVSDASKAGDGGNGGNAEGDGTQPLTSGGGSGATQALAGTASTGGATTGPTRPPKPVGKGKLGDLGSDPKAESFADKIAKKQAEEAGITPGAGTMGNAAGTGNPQVKVAGGGTGDNPGKQSASHASQAGASSAPTGTPSGAVDNNAASAAAPAGTNLSGNSTASPGQSTTQTKAGGTGKGAKSTKVMGSSGSTTQMDSPQAQRSTGGSGQGSVKNAAMSRQTPTVNRVLAGVAKASVAVAALDEDVRPLVRTGAELGVAWDQIRKPASPKVVKPKSATSPTAPADITKFTKLRPAQP